MGAGATPGASPTMVEVWVTVRRSTADAVEEDEDEEVDEGDEEHPGAAAVAGVCTPRVLIVITVPRRSSKTRTAGPPRGLRARSTNVVPATRQAIAISSNRPT